MLDAFSAFLFCGFVVHLRQSKRSGCENLELFSSASLHCHVELWLLEEQSFQIFPLPRLSSESTEAGLRLSRGRCAILGQKLPNELEQGWHVIDKLALNSTATVRQNSTRRFAIDLCNPDKLGAKHLGNFLHLLVYV